MPRRQIAEVEEIMARNAYSQRRIEAAYKRLDEAHANLTGDLRALTIPARIPWYRRIGNKNLVFIGVLLGALILDVAIVFLLARGIDSLDGLWGAR